MELLLTSLDLLIRMSCHKCEVAATGNRISRCWFCGHTGKAGPLPPAVVYPTR